MPLLDWVPDALLGHTLDDVPERLGDRTADDAINAVEAQYVRTLVARLPEREREVIFWRYGLESHPLSYREIGRRHGVSAATARTREHTALALLRAWY